MIFMVGIILTIISSITYLQLIEYTIQNKNCLFIDITKGEYICCWVINSIILISGIILIIIFH